MNLFAMLKLHYTFPFTSYLAMRIVLRIPFEKLLDSSKAMNARVLILLPIPLVHLTSNLVLLRRATMTGLRYHDVHSRAILAV
jgi:hypothetical protein